jgi:hypothetical protein
MRYQKVNTTYVALISCICAMNSSLASSGTIFLTCDILYRGKYSDGSIVNKDAKTDLTIEGAGETLRISTEGTRGDFFTADAKWRLPGIELVNRSTEDAWDVAVISSDSLGKGGTQTNRLTLNRYTGSIRIENIYPGIYYGLGEGTCKQHAKKLF